jgi:hypothetical protein
MNNTEALELVQKCLDDWPYAATRVVDIMTRLEKVKELLKEQEHNETFIVIDNKTGEEADPYNIALHEDWAKHLCYCDIEGWAIEEDGTLLLVDDCGRVAYAVRERFKVVWDA